MEGAVTGVQETVLVASLAATTWGLRAAGPALVGSRPLPARLERLIELVGPALLAGLIVWQVFADGERLVVDARAVGLAAAAAAVFARLPIPLVLVTAAAATAGARLL
jgi:branched-subunit amino acid transport protein